jgi:hypothetical protein
MRTTSTAWVTHSMSIQPDLAERLQNAAAFLRQSQAEILRRGILAEVIRLEQEHGGPFPPKPTLAERVLASRR